MKKWLKRTANSILLSAGYYFYNRKIIPVITINADTFARLLPVTDAPVFTYLFNIDEYKAFDTRYKQLQQQIETLKESLSTKAQHKSYLVESKSYLTANKELFFVDYKNENHTDVTNYRETCSDVTYFLNTRMRYAFMIIEQLAKQLPGGRASKPYITEHGTPFMHFLDTKLSNLATSAYFGDNLAAGTLFNGVQHQDLTRLGFADNSFDLVLCFEDLEHIPDYKSAIKELSRITMQEGFLLISVPFAKQSYAHIERATVGANGEIIHLMEPEYHGDPVAGKGILCFRHYGWHFLQELKQAGFANVTAIAGWKCDEMILGDNLFILCSKTTLPTLK